MKKEEKIQRGKGTRPCARNNRGKKKVTMKVQKSSISSKEIKVKTPVAFAQSNKVWKKRSFNSWIDLSFLSKIHVFLSLQMTHIRQWGIILQSTLDLSLLNVFDQHAKSSTTLRGMTLWASNFFFFLIGNEKFY